MSHIVTVKCEIRDPAAVRAACQRLGLPQPVEGSHRLFTNSATGLAVQLPKWRYPAVCDCTTGQVHYDNFKGNWGDPAKLDQFLQSYAVEKAKIEARRRGNTCTEQRLADGSIKLTINVGGAA